MRLKSLFASSAIALSLIVSACGAPQGDDVLTLKRGISAKVSTLDPHRSSAAWENIIIGDMFLGLTQHTPDGQVIPAMATDWTVSEDGMVWTFNLRETTWSDGVPLTANDFVYAMQRIQSAEVASQYAELLFVIKNAQALKEGDVAPEELGVRAIDDLTLEITLAKPAPYLLGLLTHYTTFPVPQHIVEQYGDKWTDPDNIEVNGPYKLEYERTGDQIVVDKNPLFYEADTVCFERVAYFELEDLAAVERRIEAGEMDINNGFDGGRKEELDRRLPGWVRTTPGLLTTYWSFNQTQPPFDDIRVRKALSMALDREFLVENVLTPGFIPAYSFVPPGINNYETERPEVYWKSLSRPERLEQARILLEDAGYGPENPLEFEFKHRSTDDNPKAAPVAQANWNEIAPWVNAQILRQDTQVLYSDLRENNFEVSDGAWLADYNDPLNFLYLLDSETGQQNYGNYANTEYDRLLEAAAQERDLVKRAEYFAQAEAIMLEDYPITPMWFQVTKNLVDPNLDGWAENAEDNHRSRWLCPAVQEEEGEATE